MVPNVDTFGSLPSRASARMSGGIGSVAPLGAAFGLGPSGGKSPCGTW